MAQSNRAVLWGSVNGGFAFIFEEDKVVHSVSALETVRQETPSPKLALICAADVEELLASRKMCRLSRAPRDPILFLCPDAIIVPQTDILAYNISRSTYCGRNLVQTFVIAPQDVNFRLLHICQRLLFSHGPKIMEGDNIIVLYLHM